MQNFKCHYVKIDLKAFFLETFQVVTSINVFKHAYYKHVGS